MNKYFSLLIACLMPIISLSGEDSDNKSSPQPSLNTHNWIKREFSCCCVEGEFWRGLGIGWRNDHFKGDNSHMRSQNIGLISVDLALLLEKKYLSKLNVDYGRSFLTPRQAEVYDVSFSIGYLLDYNCSLSFSPLLGYSSHRQVYKAGSKSYHNHYKFIWNGPWIGFSEIYTMNCKVKLYLDYQFHLCKFNGSFATHKKETSSIPNPSFISHRNTHNAFGNQLTLSGYYPVSENWIAGLQLELRGFWANKGNKKHCDQTLSRAACNTFHSHSKVTWSSCSLTAQLGYKY